MFLSLQQRLDGLVLYYQFDVAPRDEDQNRIIGMLEP